MPSYQYATTPHGHPAHQYTHQYSGVPQQEVLNYHREQRGALRPPQQAPPRTQTHSHPRVRFVDNDRERCIVSSDAPSEQAPVRQGVEAQGTEVPRVPRTPLIPIASLAGSALGLYASQEEDQYTPERETGLLEGIPTPANSPSSLTVPLATTILKPCPPPSTPSSEPSFDLTRFLKSPYSWDVRREPWDRVVPRDLLNALPFGAGRKAHDCLLDFLVDNGNFWEAEVRPRADGQAVTVGDILRAIHESLYKDTLEETDLFEGMPRYHGAVEERPRRLGGREDEGREIFRNIDYFPEGRCCFLGLDEKQVPDENGKTTRYLVKIGPLPPRRT